ncbi:hypothetical protein KR032_011215, partial [Drosophila birchii]
MGVTWISYRKKLELETIPLEFYFERGGTVEDMQSRLIAFARQQDHSEAVQLERNLWNDPTGDARLLSPMYLDLETNSSDKPTAPLTLLLPRSTSTAAGRRMPTKTEEPTRTINHHGDPGAALLDRMTKWGLSFDGTTDPLCFIEYIEERTDTCRIDQKYLAPALIVLLTGRAESWYRTSGLRNATWPEVRREFLDLFLPPRYYQR